MFAIFMLLCIYFCTDVLPQIYSASRKRPLSSNFELDLNLFELNFKFILDSKVSKSKSLNFKKDLNFDLNFQNLIRSILKISLFKPLV
jgi:hypothetical protein